ncbi:PilZ domain-containing protein [Mesoterricola sediminis]|uniref:PilZ domain-containing protein n=1 Tax=Mesoterricola sediminis TaxID=2927980 RepID=A0AA48KFA7_9BACT|nr:PilZ domain-containing protein [Mesoterricola sediminis]BDU78127.1 hypothetical protein METESE_30850 [Mesoterricola sediminis]
MASDDNAFVRNPAVIRDTLKRVCDRNELAILVTPNAKFDLNFLWLDQEVFHVTATMSRDEALFALKAPGLKVRFPFGPRIFSAGTRLAGLGVARGRRSLRLAIPEELENDDFRRAYRVEKVGRVQVTFSSRRYELLRGSLVNISTGGARVFAGQNLGDEDVQIDDEIHVSIPLTPAITINGRARVRHRRGNSVGMEFRPTLHGALLDDLARWTFQKREEALAQFLETEEEGPRPAPREALDLAPEVPVIGLLGGGPELEARLRELFEGLPPVRRLPATVQGVRILGERARVLVLCHVASLDPDQVRRLAILLEPLRGKRPFALLGEGVEPARMMALANDWEAVLGTTLDRDGGAPLRRLAQGLFAQEPGS